MPIHHTKVTQAKNGRLNYHKLFTDLFSYTASTVDSIDSGATLGVLSFLLLCILHTGFFLCLS